MKITIDTEDPEVIDILSRPCFACIRIAEKLRLMGHIIEHRAEAEQSAVLIWILEQKATGGERWEDEAIKALKAASANP